MQRAAITFGCAASAGLLGLLLIWQDGAKWRIPDGRLYLSPAEMRAEESSLCQGTDVIDGVDLGGQAGQPILTCSHNINADQDIYVWGDSHARHLLPGLVEAFPDQNIHILYFTSCMAQSGVGDFIHDYQGRSALREACVDRNRGAIAYFQNLSPTSVILHQYFGYEGQFSSQWYSATEELFETLESRGHRVAFIGGVPRPGVSVAECVAVTALFTNGFIEGRCAVNSELAMQVTGWNAEVAVHLSRHFIDVSPVFCSNEFDCRATDGSTLLYRDTHHLTVYGSRQLIRSIGAELSQLINIAQ